MNDFIYPPLPNNVPKMSGDFYDTRTFKSNSISLPPQEYEQVRSNSLPAFNNNSNSLNNPTSCDLQDVIFYYQSQPDLLRLILLSKVEEDKRRAEEAKLKAKELEMFLLQQQHQQPGSPQTPETSMISSTTNTTTSTLNNNMLPLDRRPSVLDILMDNTAQRRDSALGSFDESANSEEFDESTTNSLLSSMSLSNQPPMMPTTLPRNSLHPLSPPYTFQSPIEEFNPTLNTTITSPTQQDTNSKRHDSYFPQRPRRRREMQAISKIVETRDYPYIDGFFWKNNGNTIQKKTGNKSVYYKCSNSSKGCPVNKTVTWKDNGEYLIKYRGEHLPDCGKVQRIVDM